MCIYCTHIQTRFDILLADIYQFNTPPLTFAVTIVIILYSETSLIRHAMGPENNVGLGGCWIMERLLPYLSMVTVPHIMVGLERMLDYRGAELERFHCNSYKNMSFNNFVTELT